MADEKSIKKLIKYINENILRLRVFLKDPYVEVIERVEKISSATLFSNVGGVMGLCLGFSVLSGVEIIYFIIMWIVWKTRPVKVVKIGIGRFQEQSKF